MEQAVDRISESKIKSTENIDEGTEKTGQAANDIFNEKPCENDSESCAYIAGDGLVADRVGRLLIVSVRSTAGSTRILLIKESLTGILRSLLTGTLGEILIGILRSLLAGALGEILIGILRSLLAGTLGEILIRILRSLLVGGLWEKS